MLLIHSPQEAPIAFICEVEQIGKQCGLPIETIWITTGATFAK
jgi:hypothetical protein